MRGLIYFLLGCCVLVGCQESVETRKQRYLAQGNNSVKIRNVEEAERFYKEALKLDSCFADAWNNLGSLQYSLRKYSAAMMSYNEALTCKINYTEAYLNRANTAYELKEYYLALSDLEKVEKVKPDTVALHFARALVLTKLRRFDDAIKSFERAKALDTTNIEIDVNLGTLYYYKKDYKTAKEHFGRILKGHEDEPHTYNALAMVEGDLGNFDEALRLVNKALAKESSDAYFLNNRGYFKLMLGDIEGGREDIDRSIQIDPYNGWSYRNKGIYFVKKNQLQDAIRLLERAEKMDSFIENVYSYLAEVYANTGQQEKACAALVKSIERKENRAVSIKGC
jgi:tetratricopeptide (TPR) repeat protein